MRAAFAAAFARRDRDSWVAELSGDDTCVAPVQAVSEIAHDPQFTARGAVVEAKDTDGRTLLPGGRRPGRHAAGVGTGDRPRPGRAPTPTSSCEAAGIDPARIAELRREGVVA